MGQVSLASAKVGRQLRIATIDLDRESSGWLDAVGLHVGEELVVLRRALFGGPLHVRTSAGGEFAVARELAASIGIVPTSTIASEDLLVRSSSREEAVVARAVGAGLEG